MQRMAWGLVILCAIIGALGALRPAGRTQDFKRAQEED
jgi:hypothetical protein